MTGQRLKRTVTLYPKEIEAIVASLEVAADDDEKLVIERIGLNHLQADRLLRKLRKAHGGGL